MGSRGFPNCRSLRLLREIHAELMKGVRGGEKSPGEFRTSQNWIGGRGSTLRDASFIPPPPHEVMNVMGQLETFLHTERARVPLLIRCGLAHAQFETIHPFWTATAAWGACSSPSCCAKKRRCPGPCSTCRFT